MQILACGGGDQLAADAAISSTCSFETLSTVQHFLQLELQRMKFGAHTTRSYGVLQGSGGKCKGHILGGGDRWHSS